MNGPALNTFRTQVGWLWHRVLPRRSQNGRVRWDRMRRLIDRWLPPVRIVHPYPLRRLGVVARGKSRMREIRSSGSVEGVMSNHDPCSDPCGVRSLATAQSAVWKDARGEISQMSISGPVVMPFPQPGPSWSKCAHTSANSRRMRMEQAESPEFMAQTHFSATPKPKGNGL